MQAIEFPAVEAAMVGWLADVLPDYGVNHPVSTKVPNPRPGQFIRVQRTGGPRQNLVVDGAQVTFEVWDEDAPSAEEAAQTVRAVVNAARNTRTPSGDLISHVNEFVGPALLPDPSNQPRYSWTVQVHMRGVPLPSAP